MEEMQGKSSLVAVKQLIKFQERVQKCQKLVRKTLIQDAVQELQDIINNCQFLDVYEFKGEGNSERWNGLYSKGPFQWYEQSPERQQVDNPFDLLCLCFSIQLHAKKMTTELIMNVYQELQEKLASRLQILFGMANIYYNDSQYLQAEKYYKRILRMDPSSLRALEAMAWISYRFGQRQVSLVYCEKILKYQPSNRGLQMIHVLCRGSSKAEEKRQLQVLSEKWPQYYKFYLKLGDLSEKRQVRLEWFNKALSRGCRGSEVEAKIALSYLQCGVIYDECRKHIDLSLFKQNNQMALKVKGKLELKKRNFQVAIDAYLKAAELAPYCFDVYRKLGEIYFRNLKDMPNAVKYFAKYCNLNPYFSKIYCYLGLAFQEMKLFTEATKYYEQAIEVGSNPSLALGYLASIHFQKGQYQKALEQFSRANQENPENLSFCEGIYNCYWKLGCSREAEEWAKKLIANSSSVIKKAFYKHLGDLKYHFRHFEQALKLYLMFQNCSKSLSLNFIKRKYCGQNQVINGIDTVRSVKEASKCMPKDAQHIYGWVQIGYLMKQCGLLVQSAVVLQQVLGMSMGRGLVKRLKNIY